LYGQPDTFGPPICGRLVGATSRLAHRIGYGESGVTSHIMVRNISIITDVWYDYRDIEHYFHVYAQNNKGPNIPLFGGTIGDYFPDQLRSKTE
jgi:hypothetical protein